MSMQLGELKKWATNDFQLDRKRGGLAGGVLAECP